MRRVSIIILALALCVGCGSNQPKESAKSESKRVLTKSQRAVEQTISLVEEFTSEIFAYRENSITPAASGVRIDKILFDVGDSVTEGEVVATLDPTLYNQQMTSVALLKSDYERLLPVYAEGGVSKQVVDQAKSALDLQSEVAANIKRNIELVSPLSGVVSERNAEAGDLFANQAILHIEQIDKVKVLAQISEQYFRDVEVGMGVDLVVEILPELRFKGRVSLIYPTLDPATRTFTVEVTVPNSSLTLRPGMFAHARFNMGERRAILVPDIAVQKQYGSAEHYVYVVEQGVARRRSVTRGRQVGSLIEITSGVESGDEILTTAFSRISDGVEVEIKGEEKL